MTAPLAVLAAGALLAGLLGLPRIWGGSFAIEGWLEPALTFGRAQLAPAAEHGGAGLAWGSWPCPPRWPWRRATGVPRLPAGPAGRRPSPAASRPCTAPWPTSSTWTRRWRPPLAPVRWLAQLSWKAFDVILIDGMG